MDLPDHLHKKEILIDELAEAVRKCDKYIKDIHAIEDAVAKIHGWCITHRKAQAGTKIGIGVIGIAGGICTIIAPFTCGASLIGLGIAGGVIGATAGVAGVGHAIGSHVVNTNHRNELIAQSNVFLVASKEYGQDLAQAAQSAIPLSADMFIRSGLGLGQLTVGITELIITKVSLYQASLPVVKTAFDAHLQALPRVDMMQKFLNGLPAAPNSAGSVAPSVPSVVNQGSVGTGSGMAASASEAGAVTAGTGAKIFGVIGGTISIAVGGYDIFCGISQLCNDGENEKVALALLAELLKMRASVYEVRAALLHECVRRVELIGATQERRRASRSTKVELNTLPGFAHFDTAFGLHTLPGFADFEIPSSSDFEVYLNLDPLGHLQTADS